MSFLNPLNVKQNSVVAIVDISSAQVSGALVSILVDKKGNQKSQIIFNTRVSLASEKNLDFDSFSLNVLEAIKKITHNLLNSGLSIPKKFVCFIGSPFLVSQTKIINYSQPEDFVFTKDILAKIVQQKIDDFRLENSQTGQFSIIESKIMQIKLDGYELHQPFGHQIKEFRIAQFLAGVSTGQLTAIKQAIFSQSHNNQIDFHSMAFASFSILRDILDQKKNFLVIDVSGELTDFFVCQDGVLVENLSFPGGINSILRNIAFQQKTFTDEVKSQLNLYVTGKLHKSTKEVFERSLNIYRQEWITSLVEAINLVSAELVVPEHIVLLGDTKANQIFKIWLQSEDFKKYKLSNNPFSVSYINYSNLSDINNRPNIARDTCLVFESLFFDKINK